MCMIGLLFGSSQVLSISRHPETCVGVRHGHSIGEAGGEKVTCIVCDCAHSDLFLLSLFSSAPAPAPPSHPFLPLKPERSQYIFCSVPRSLNTSEKQDASRRGERLAEFRDMSREARDQWVPCKSGWLQPLLPIGLGLSPAMLSLLLAQATLGIQAAEIQRQRMNSSRTNADP